MPEAFIGLGSNLGHGQKNLLTAWARLGQRAGIRLVTISRPYHTQPQDIDTARWFTNAVGMISTSLGPLEILSALLAVEAEMGRDRSQGRDRPVDLDLLFYGDEIHQTEALVLPHPELHRRLFVLEPLYELAPDLCHPVRHENTAQMLEKAKRHNPSMVIPLKWSTTGDMPWPE